MATYKEIQAQIADLQKEAQEARRVEFEDALKKVRELISEHGLTIGDIGKRAFSAGAGAKAGTKAPAVVKYRNQATGEIWSGRGKRPGWIKQAFDEGRADEYLVENARQAPAKKVAAKKTRVAAKKAAAKKAAGK